MNNIDKMSVDAMSVLKAWNKDNKVKICEYVKLHQWLKADILKLNACIKENNLVQVAVTDTDIYGITNKGILFITGRGNYGIASNFA